MEIDLKTVIRQLKQLNPILQIQDEYNSNEIKEMIITMTTLCTLMIGMINLKAIESGFVFDVWCKQSNEFKEFLGLYGEFCSHISQRWINLKEE